MARGCGRCYIQRPGFPPAPVCAQNRATGPIDASCFQGGGAAASLTSEGVKAVMYHHVKMTLTSVGYLFTGARHNKGSSQGTQRQGEWSSQSDRAGSSDLKTIISNTGHPVRMLWQATAGLCLGLRGRHETFLRSRVLVGALVPLAPRAHTRATPRRNWTGMENRRG
jgi:hypothetical protein